MHKNKLLVAMMLTSTLALNGCVVAMGNKGGWDGKSTWEEQQQLNRKNLEKVDLGMSVAEVRTIMGTADFNELHQLDAGVVQVLYFRTHRNKGDGKTAKDECTAVVFRDGAVIGWGDRAYADATRSSL
ncbi:DUF3192 domain-containing protein [Ferrimonas marina]|uniref:SmpA / OmlA family protein n=1 Tax=Ferrimonas marina TaxID=299255 RepID=A0A1M5YFX2_9GAMM|nr:DUF3192 domain-containing protein [Ferrimonas marina]SHI10940.1 Protein of unknown function [Ferrimonas marina]